MIRYDCGPDGLHPYDTHSRWWHGGLLGLQTVVNPWSCPWVLSTDIRFYGESQNFVDSVGSFSLLFWRHVLLEEFFKSVLFWAFSQSSTAPSAGSSLWASAQSITCICTNAQPAATHTSCSKWWPLSTMVGSWTSIQCTVPNATLLRIDLTMSGSSQVATQLSTSATVLSHPFWYSNSKLNCTRALTHRWPVASRFSVIIMWVKGLLSIFSRKGW